MVDVLVIVLFNVAVVCGVRLSPVVFGLSTATQLYVDGTLLVKAIFTGAPLQIVAVPALVISGVGLTVTVTVCGVPGQLPVADVGVTVYVTV